MAMFKGFKPQGLQKIANSMGYIGSLEGFDSYLQQNPDKQNMMNMYNQRAMQMAQGGAVLRMQQGGSVFYDSKGNKYEGVGGNYNEKGQLAFKQRYQQDPETGSTAIRNVYVDPNQKFYSRNPRTEVDPIDPSSLSSLGYNIPKPPNPNNIAKATLGGNMIPAGERDQTSALQPINTDDFGKFRNEDPGFSRPTYKNSPKNANTLPDYEAFKKYQSTIPNNMFRASSAVVVPRRLADGTVVNFGSPLQAEDYDNYLKSIGKPPTTSTQGGIFQNLYRSDEQADQVAGGFPKRGTEEFNRATGGGGFPAQEPNRTAAVKNQQPQIQYPKSYMSGYTTQDGKTIEAPFKSSRSPLEIYTTKEDYANYASQTYDDRRAYYNNEIKKLTDRGFVLQADGYYRNPKTGGASKIGGFDDVLKQSKEQYVAKQLEAKNRYDAERANSPAGSLDFREQQKASELKRDKENVSKLNENLIKQGLSPVDANFYDSPEYKYYLDNRSMIGMPASGFSKYFGAQNSQEPGGTREKAYEAYLKRTGQDDIINKANNFRNPNLGFIGSDGIIRPSNIGDRRSEGFPSPIASESQRLAPWMEGYDFVGKKSLEEMNADLDKREREYKEANPNWQQEFQDEMERDRQRQRDLQNFNPNNTSQPTGTTMATDTNIEDFSVQQALNPTLPQGGATVATDIQQDPSQMIDPATGQLRPQAPTIGTATLGTTTTSTAPTATPASTMDASLSNLNVTQALQPVQAAQGAVSQQSQMTAQQQTDSKVSDLQAAQGAATLMQNPVQREIQAGELISGGAANAEKASTYAEQIEAATATPSAQATVQGQLANLTANFDATNPPAWAAGALRGVQAQMAARGLGTSSMAAQALIQGALESALPIAQADAQTRASFEQANLSNRQQRAMLAAQQRAAFIGQEFDQEFQSRVQNAAKISDIANMNFTAEQQIALENSRAANTMGLANLSNRQAMVMAEASALANLDMSNLSNRQQAAVQNAQAFMQMDMANLNNNQQTGMFKAQSLVQSLFNDQAATNASRQFNASSQNQTDQFFANLATTVANFNAEQANAMSRYNSGELNALEQFNANMKNQREQFNTQNRLVIDQSNAQWRRQVATADTAAINRANELNARALIDLSTGAYNNLWQGFRDDMEFAWKTADNAEERSKDILLRKMQDESTVAAAALAADQENASALASGLINLATTNTGGTLINTVVDGVSSAASWLWDLF